MTSEGTSRTFRAVIAPVLHPFRTGLESVLAVLFPPNCLLCGTLAPGFEQHSVCLGCWEKIRPMTGPQCSRCGLPIESTHAYADGTTPLCGVCTTAPPPFVVARAYAPYQDEVRELVHRLKFGGRQDLAKRMGARMAEVCARVSDLAECDVLVPVPLHPRRRRERGFNQAELLAEVVARRNGQEIARHALVRSRDTQSQSGLTDRQRQDNIRGAFRVRRPARIAGKRVLLVDDVYTTGATLKACTGALLDAGAAQVCIVTLARVPRRS